MELLHWSYNATQSSISLLYSFDMIFYLHYAGIIIPCIIQKLSNYYNPIRVKYVCMFACTHAWSHTHIHTHTYIPPHTNIHTYMYTHTYVQVYTYTHTYMCMYTHPCIHIVLTNGAMAAYINDERS